jgi:hypothetical protein
MIAPSLNRQAERTIRFEKIFSSIITDVDRSLSVIQYIVISAIRSAFFQQYEICGEGLYCFARDTEYQRRAHVTLVSVSCEKKWCCHIGSDNRDIETLVNTLVVLSKAD